MTLFECYGEYRPTLLAKLKAATSTVAAQQTLCEGMDMVQYRYAQEPIKDGERELLASMMSAVKTSFPLLECASEAKVWQEAGNAGGKKRRSKKPLAVAIFVLALAACTLTALVFLSQNQSVTLEGLSPYLYACAVCAAAFTAAGGLFMYKTAASEAARQSIEISINPDDVVRRLTAVILQMDKNLASAKANEAKRAAAGPAGPLSADELELVSSLLEARYSQNGEFALEALDDLDEWLERRGLTLCEYDDKHEELFELLPSEQETMTLRPAILYGGVLVKRGLATCGGEG